MDFSFLFHDYKEIFASLEKKTMFNLDIILKCRDITFLKWFIFSKLESLYLAAKGVIIELEFIKLTIK